MEQPIKFKSLVPVPEPNQFPRISAFYDAAEYIVERTMQLIMKAKFLIFGLAFLLLLIYEIADFGRYKLEQWRNDNQPKRVVTGPVMDTKGHGE